MAELNGKIASLRSHSLPCDNLLSHHAESFRKGNKLRHSE
jgi:hypothetical protein